MSLIPALVRGGYGFAVNPRGQIFKPLDVGLDLFCERAEGRKEEILWYDDLSALLDASRAVLCYSLLGPLRRKRMLSWQKPRSSVWYAMRASPSRL